MTRQKMFKVVLKHLDQQGHPALTEGGACVYQNEKKEKCAVGCLITGYKPDMDTFSWTVEKLIREGYLPTTNKKDDVFLHRLQSLHDASNSDTWSEIPEKAKEIAKEFKLKDGFLEELSFKWKE